MGRDCKREKRGKKWGEINIKPKELDETVRERRKGKNQGEINIKPKEWDETVRERREEKTGAR